MFGYGFKLSLGIFFALFILFLYGPTFSILVLSFQGPNGGLTFPMRGFSTFWFESLLTVLELSIYGEHLEDQSVLDLL